MNSPRLIDVAYLEGELLTGYDVFRLILVGTQLILSAWHATPEILRALLVALPIEGHRLHMLHHVGARARTLLAVEGHEIIVVENEEENVSGEGAVRLLTIQGDIAINVAEGCLGAVLIGFLYAEFSEQTKEFLVAILPVQVKCRCSAVR